MDIVLKENDVKRMLGEALGVDIDPEDMIVTKDPFTVTISNAEVYLSQKKEEKPLRRKDPPAPAPTSEPVDDDHLPSEDDAPMLSMADIQRQSAAIAVTPPITGNETTGKRALRPNEIDTTPPPTKGGKERL